MVCCDFVENKENGYGIGFINWLGDNVFGMKYVEEDKCFVGEIDGRKTVMFFNYTKYYEVEVIEKSTELFGTVRYYTERHSLNKIAEKYKKYIGYDCVEMSCYTNHDGDYYEWSAFFKGNIGEDGWFSKVNNDKSNAYNKMMYSKMYNADINYNKETVPFRIWKGSDVDDCKAAYNYGKKIGVIYNKPEVNEEDVLF